MSEEQSKLVVFQEKGIRREWYNDEWWFSVVDIIEVLTESTKPRDYWYRLKKREKANNGLELSTNCRHFKMIAADGKSRKTECANTEWLFRIIQSIPSPKAEPFKQWLAKVGYERIQEIENPELAAERARSYYRDLGYSEDWISKRLQGIEIRGKLTDEWKERGVQEGKEYSILTAEISRATFGKTPSQYKDFKGLKRENLRDHMTDLELIFNMLAETTTRNKAVEKDAQGFQQNRSAAIEGGQAAGAARETYEKQTGTKVVSNKNAKHQIAEAKKAKKLAAKQKKLEEKEKAKKDKK
jgi:hypothetical protein